MREKPYKRLPPVERKQDGSLYRMTPAQRKQANALIRRECCNYEDGNCMLLDDGEIVLAPAGINVWIAGVLFLLPFVMGFQRSCPVPLCFLNRKIACCAMKLLSPFHSFPGLFHRKIPQKISRIG